ncbi:uncharacterized protein DMAD_10914 [Drosophila madeirensis]|uniref:Uncharacterized protein n=1 Tax=Drosophila madeirensis TaxID=30013 RepID=A0AAU9FBC7_DROMD
MGKAWLKTTAADSDIDRDNALAAGLRSSSCGMALPQRKKTIEIVSHALEQLAALVWIWIRVCHCWTNKTPVLRGRDTHADAEENLWHSFWVFALCAKAHG